MALWRKPLQFINVVLANRSPMSVAERGPGRMTYAKTRSSVSLNLRFDAWPLTNITLYKIVSIQYLFITTHGFHVNKFNTVTYGSTVFK